MRKRFPHRRGGVPASARWLGLGTPSIVFPTGVGVYREIAILTGRITESGFPHRRGGVPGTTQFEDNAILRYCFPHRRGGVPRHV